MSDGQRSSKGTKRGKPASKRGGSAASRQRARSSKSKAKKHRRAQGLSGYLTGPNIRLALNAMFTCLILGLLALAYFMHDLPDISTLTKVSKAHSLVIRTEKGDVIGSSGDLYGEYLNYNEIPRDLVRAVVATEDRNFFNHIGIDPFGLLRAAFANFRAGRIVQGGSTITQQLAKNVFLTPERSLKRKVQEVLLAFGLEYRYDKTDIITVYLNRVYFGAGTYGIDAASRRYFGKSARDMFLPESAMIAGLLKAPSRYAPTSNPDLAKRRATQVLVNMEDAGLISKEQLEAGRKTYDTIEFAKIASTSDTRYYTDWVMEQIPNYVGNIEADLIVTTTFDPQLQREAEAAVDAVLTDKVMTDYRTSQVALVSMNTDGAVRAMIGGRDYGVSQFNRAEQARRQPGSSFKAFVYLAALEEGFQANDLIIDAPVVVDGWTPGNYDGEYLGEITLREAYAKSVNTVAVRLSEAVGRHKVINMAHRLGLQANMDPIPSIALGVTESSLLEMTNAYAHLASGGNMVIPYAILKIEDVYGHVIYEREPLYTTRVLQPQLVARMNDLMAAVVEGGTGAGASIGRSAAGKTGTSQDFRDAWFIGYTPQMITGVWVGNDDNSSMKKVTGGKFPAQIWRAYMKQAMAGLPDEQLPRASGGGGWFDGGGQIMRHEPRLQRSGGGSQNFWNNLFDGGQVGGEPSERPESQRIRR